MVDNSRSWELGKVVVLSVVFFACLISVFFITIVHERGFQEITTDGNLSIYELGIIDLEKTCLEIDSLNPVDVIFHSLDNVYGCSGTCYCDGERRSSSMRFSKLFNVFVPAVTSILAYEKAKEYFSTECEELISSECGGSEVMSIVEECDLEEAKIQELVVFAEEMLSELQTACQYSLSQADPAATFFQRFEEIRSKHVDDVATQFFGWLRDRVFTYIYMTIVHRRAEKRDKSSRYKIVYEGECGNGTKQVTVRCEESWFYFDDEFAESIKPQLLESSEFLKKLREVCSRKVENGKLLDVPALWYQKGNLDVGRKDRCLEGKYFIDNIVPEVLKDSIEVPEEGIEEEFEE